MAIEEGSPTRRSGRERVQTPKAVELGRKRRETRGQNRSSKDETEDIIEVDKRVPAPPRPRRTEINAYLKDRVVATKIRALSAKAGERSETMAANSSQLAREKAQ